MTHHASARFWSCYERLPGEIRRQADQAYVKLKEDPSYPGLSLKKVGRFWSVRIDLHYRALAVESVDDFVWFWIGTHAEYDHLVR